MHVGHLYTTFRDNLKDTSLTLCRDRAPKGVCDPHLRPFLMSILLLECIVLPKFYSNLEHGFISMQKSNKCKRVTLPKNKYTSGSTFFSVLFMPILLKKIYSQCSQCFSTSCSHLPASRVYMSILNNAFN